MHEHSVLFTHTTQWAGSTDQSYSKSCYHCDGSSVRRIRHTSMPTHVIASALLKQVWH